jgi:hypothetical protein
MWPVCLESFSSQQFLMPIAPWFFNSYKPWGVVSDLFFNLKGSCDQGHAFSLKLFLPILRFLYVFPSGQDFTVTTTIGLLINFWGVWQSKVLLQKLHLGNRAPIFTLIRALDQTSDGDHLVLFLVSLLTVC